jgi:hypothetical protein
MFHFLVLFIQNLFIRNYIMSIVGLEPLTIGMVASLAIHYTNITY